MFHFMRSLLSVMGSLEMLLQSSVLHQTYKAYYASLRLHWTCAPCLTQRPVRSNHYVMIECVVQLVWVLVKSTSF